MNATTAPTTPDRQTNWAFVIRVGVVVTIIGALVGYAAYTTYQLLVNHGIRDEDGIKVVELQAMSNFEMNEVHGTLADIPAQFRGLDGQKVKLVGEVAPGGSFSAASKVNEFDLCYSVQKCCFGGPPKPQHFVKCRAPGSRPLDIGTGGVVEVVGTLRIKFIRDGGRISSVFQMEVDRTRPL